MTCTTCAVYVVSSLWIDVVFSLQIHHVVYDHADEYKLHDLLRSTKYFGSMVWYLVTVKNSIAGLLKDMLSRNLYVCVRACVNNYISNGNHLLESIPTFYFVPQ